MAEVISFFNTQVLYLEVVLVRSSRSSGSTVFAQSTTLKVVNASR
jgi:hypothetical protein